MEDLLVLLDQSHGDTVQITLAVLGDLAATTLDRIEKREREKASVRRSNDNNTERNIFFSSFMFLPLLAGSEDTNLLERLEDLAVDGGRGINVVGGAGATVDAATVDLAKSTDTNSLADVDVASDRGYLEKIK